MSKKNKIINGTITALLALWLITSNIFATRLNQYFATISLLSAEGSNSIEYYSKDHLQPFELVPGETLCLPVRFEGRVVRVGVYMGRQADSSDTYIFQLEDKYGSILGKTETHLSDIVEDGFVYIPLRSVISTADSYFIRIFAQDPKTSTHSLWLNVSLADSFETDSFTIQEKVSGYTLVLDKRYQAIDGQILLLINVLLVGGTAALWIFSSAQIRAWLKKTLKRCMQAIQWKRVNLIAIVLLVLADIALFFFPNVQYIGQFSNRKEYSENAERIQAVALSEDVIVEQRIPPVRGTIDTIEVLFGTYTQEIKGGTVNIELWDDGNNDLIYSGKVATEQIKDNEYQRIQFPTARELAGSPLRIRMWAEYEVPGQCVAFYLNNNYSENMFAEIGNEPSNSSLIFDLSQRVNIFRVREFVVITGVLLVLAILYVWNFIQFRRRLVRYTLCSVLSAVLLLAPVMSLVNYSEISLDGIAATLPIRQEYLPSRQYGQDTLTEKLSVKKVYDFAGGVFSIRERTELPVHGMIRDISLSFLDEATLLKDYLIMIYWDTGSGYNDKQLYVYRYVNQGGNSVSFQIPCNEAVWNILVSVEDTSGGTYALPDQIFPLTAVAINTIADTSQKSVTALAFLGICIGTIVIGLWMYFQMEEKTAQWFAHKKISISVIFVILATIYGSLLSFLIPTWQVPDEGAHIGMLYGDLGNPSMSEKLGEALDDQGLDGVMLFAGKPVDSDKYFAATKNQLKDYSFHYSSLSPKILRRPGQVLGVVLGQLLHLPAYWILQLGELGALAVYIAMGALTLRIIPFKKNLMMMIMLLPMVMQEASSFAHDSFNNALAFFAIAYILHLKVCAEKVGWKQVIVLAMLAVGLLLGKVIYVLLLALVFVVPLCKLELKIGGSKGTVINETWVRQHWMQVTIFLLAGICICAVGSFAFLKRLGYGEIESMLLGYIMSFPQLLRLMLTTVVVHWKNWLHGTVCNFGWFDVLGNDLFMWFVIVSIFLIAVMHHRKTTEQTAVHKDMPDGEFSAVNMVIWYGVFAAIFAAVLMSMVGWGFYVFGIDASLPYSASMRLLPRIEGVQGRYFFPILPLLFIPIHTKRDILSFVPCHLYKIVYYVVVIIYPVSLLLVRYWGVGHW